MRRDLIDNWVDTGQQQHPWNGAVDPAKLPVGERIEIVSYIDYGPARWANRKNSMMAQAINFWRSKWERKKEALAGHLS